MGQSTFVSFDGANVGLLFISHKKKDKNSMKIIILLLSVLGFANMWLAVFADTGLTLLTILNTLRIMKRFA